MQRLQLICLTEVPKSVLDAIVKGLQEIFDLKVSIGPTVELPIEAYDPLRCQYRADRIVDFLLSKFKGRVLGVMDQDLYTEPLNFVFGQAQLGGRAAVLSITRLRPEFYGGKDEGLLIERAVKEAIHEVGHVLGLGHCTALGCVMKFSNSVLEVDAKSGRLCNRCLARLKA
jgi:archaemetzincin